MLTSAHIAEGVDRICARLDRVRDALNAADRRLGDGDTGMTIEQIATAWRSVRMRDESNVGLVIAALGAATAEASGSSLASVIATGLQAAGRKVDDRPSLDHIGIADALAAASAAITARSGAQVGDKTVLDSIVAIDEAMKAAMEEADLRLVAETAAADALRNYRDRQCRVGRARMYGARSIGCDDPGMLAVLLMLQAADRSTATS